MSLHEIGCTFLGRNCSQSWADFQLWEQLLNAHPELQSIVELGTGEAGFSRYLQLQAEARSLEFATFDRVHMDHKQSGFHLCDIFGDPEAVALCLARPAVLFCDDGDKPHEVEVFAPLLHQRDILVVHDWNTEITQADIPPTLAPLHEEWWATTAIFRRT